MFNTVLITGKLKSLPTTKGDFIIEDQKKANFWVSGNPKYIQTIQLNQEVTIQGQILESTGKKGWLKQTIIQCFTLKYGILNPREIPYFNKVILDGIIGCNPQIKANPVDGKKRITFLIFNNDKNSSRGLWCEASVSQIKKVKKGKDVIAEGRLCIGYQKDDQGNWLDGTYLQIQKLLRGRL